MAVVVLSVSQPLDEVSDIPDMVRSSALLSSGEKTYTGAVGLLR